MDADRHGQEVTVALSGNVVKCFCALVVTAKRSVDELFMHYFHNLSSTSGALPQDLSGIHPWAPLGDIRPQIPSLPTRGKKLLSGVYAC